MSESKQIQVYNRYTYRDYLDEWEARFDGDDSGDYSYYSRGARIPCTVHKLSLEQFEQHVKAIEATAIEFGKAYDNGDDEGMRRALADRFPHELALLV